MNEGRTFPSFARLDNKDTGSIVQVHRLIGDEAMIKYVTIHENFLDFINPDVVNKERLFYFKEEEDNYGHIKTLDLPLTPPSIIILNKQVREKEPRTTCKNCSSSAAPKGGARKARKTRKARKARKARKTRKTRKH